MILCGLLTSGVLTGCGYISFEIVIDEPAVPLAGLQPEFSIPMPSSPGYLTQSNDRAVIDYSNMRDGYVTVEYLENTDRMLRVVITSPGDSSYIYDLNPDKSDKFPVSEVLPLTEGNGLYTIGVYRHNEDAKYTPVLLTSVEVELVEEAAPFIRPSQIVNYGEKSLAVETAAELVPASGCYFGTIESILTFVVDNIEFDAEFLEIAEGRYIPDIDSTITLGSGICYDIAVLTAAMLRSQGIPTKLVVGYYDDIRVGAVYHAWITVYSEVSGQAGGHTFYGDAWNILDPTLIIGDGFRKAAQIAADGSRYNAMFYY